VFLLVPAYPGSPGPKAVKQLLLLLLSKAIFFVLCACVSGPCVNLFIVLVDPGSAVHDETDTRTQTQLKTMPYLIRWVTGRSLLPGLVCETCYLHLCVWLTTLSSSRSSDGQSSVNSLTAD